MRYDTIIFDMDGTILNTLEDLADSVNHLLNKYGFPTRTYDEIRSYVGNGIRRTIEQALPAEESNAENIDKLFKEFGPYYKEHSRIKTAPYDNIIELIRTLDDMGIKMAIASNKADEAVKVLNETIFENIIHVALGEQSGMNRKPAPDIVYKALEMLNSTKENALYVGDSEVDYKTAKAAGVDLILVSWGFRDKKELMKLECKSIIDNPFELLEFILS